MLERGSLKVRHQNNYTVEWRWKFEHDEGMDEVDTDIGNITVNQLLGVNAAIYVYAEQNTDLGTKLTMSGNEPKADTLNGLVRGDEPKPGDTSNILLYIVLMAISACGILIFFVTNRRRKMGEDVKDDQK